MVKSFLKRTPQYKVQEELEKRLAQQDRDIAMACRTVLHYAASVYGNAPTIFNIAPAVIKLSDYAAHMQEGAPLRITKEQRTRHIYNLVIKKDGIMERQKDGRATPLPGKILIGSIDQKTRTAYGGANAFMKRFRPVFGSHDEYLAMIKGLPEQKVDLAGDVRHFSNRIPPAAFERTAMLLVPTISRLDMLFSRNVAEDGSVFYAIDGIVLGIEKCQVLS